MAVQPNFFAVAAHIATKHEAAIGAAMLKVVGGAPKGHWVRTTESVANHENRKRLAHEALMRKVAASRACLAKGPTTMSQLIAAVGLSKKDGEKVLNLLGAQRLRDKVQTSSRGYAYQYTLPRMAAE